MNWAYTQKSTTMLGLIRDVETKSKMYNGYTVYIHIYVVGNDLNF